jgi:putative oxidoreductase
MSTGESVSALLGRWILAWLFLVLTYRYASDWSAMTGLLTAKGVSTAPLALLAGLVANILGSVSLLLGFHVRAGAALLFLVTIGATMTIYDFWNTTDPAARQADFDIFARNIGIAGALLLLIGTGAGKFALDNRERRD